MNFVKKFSYKTLMLLLWKSKQVTLFNIIGCALDIQNKAGEHPLLTAVIYHSEFQVSINLYKAFYEQTRGTN